MPPPLEPETLHTIAPAKINWTLEVLGRRPDGYHEVRSVMQTITLADELSLRSAASDGLVVTGDGADALGGPDNLVLRALRSLRRHCGGTPVSYHLSKRIPAAAGLGGGSSDAAAALRLLHRHWRLDASLDLSDIAAALGSDVPFFLRGGAQLAEGRGEQLTPLPASAPVSLILATPPITLPEKSARLYAELGPEHYSDGAETERLVTKLRAGLSPGREDYINVFDLVADRVFPRLGEYRRRFQQVTGLEPCLAGAGPSLFGVCEPSIDGRAVAASIAALVQQGFRAWSVHTTGHIPPLAP